MSEMHGPGTPQTVDQTAPPVNCEPIPATEPAGGPDPNPLRRRAIDGEAHAATLREHLQSIEEMLNQGTMMSIGVQLVVPESARNRVRRLLSRCQALQKQVEADRSADDADGADTDLKAELATAQEQRRKAEAERDTAETVAKMRFGLLKTLQQRAETAEAEIEKFVAYSEQCEATIRGARSEAEAAQAEADNLRSEVDYMRMIGALIVRLTQHGLMQEAWCDIRRTARTDDADKEGDDA